MTSAVQSRVDFSQQRIEIENSIVYVPYSIIPFHGTFSDIDVSVLLCFSVAENSSLADFGGEMVLTIGEEETVQQLLLPLVNDDVVEANEVIQVRLSIAVDDNIELTADTATIFIIDDDGQLITIMPSFLNINFWVVFFLQK